MFIRYTTRPQIGTHAQSRTGICSLGESRPVHLNDASIFSKLGGAGRFELPFAA